MSKWYFRDGTLAVTAKIGSSDWRVQMKKIDNLLGDNKYKRIAETTVGKYWVSTVWLGLDYNFNPHGKPLIFETAVFDTSKKRLMKFITKPRMTIGEEVDINRYSTEAQAMAGHQKMVKKWSQFEQS